MKRKRNLLSPTEGIFHKILNRIKGSKNVRTDRPQIIFDLFLKFSKDKRQLRLTSNKKMEEKIIQTDPWRNQINHAETQCDLSSGVQEFHNCQFYIQLRKKNTSRKFSI